MDEQVIFKTSTFGGFEKKGVLTYIDEMGQKTKQAQETLEQKLQEMSSARDGLAQQIATFEQKITGLEDQLRGEREKITELTGVINGLNQEITAQKRITMEKDNAIALEQEHNRQLQFKAEALEFKSRKYDETAMKVGSILVEAKQSADKMIEQAEDEALEVRKNTERSMATISGEIDSFRVDVAGLRQSIVDVMGSIAGRLDTLEQSIDEIEERCKTITFPDGKGEAVVVLDAQEPSQEEDFFPTATSDGRPQVG